MVKTLVTGGTGFIGTHIVRQLLRSRESVRVLTRNPDSLPPSRRVAGTEFYKGDVFDPTSLGAAMHGCDAVVCAVQFENAPFENPAKGQTYERVDGEGTALQVAAAKQAGVKRFIYISGAGTREGRTEPWFKAKAKAEAAVRESGMDWTIFRPSWVYGSEDRSLNKFAMFSRLSPIVPIIGTGKEKIQPVFVDDVARAVALSLNQAKAYGKVLEMGGPETLTMTQIVQTMLLVSKRKRLVFPQPKALMKFIASVVQYLPGRPLTPGGVDFVTMEEKVDNSVLLETLSLSLTPLQDGLKTYLSPDSPVSMNHSLQRHAA